MSGPTGESRRHPRFSVDVEAKVWTSTGQALLARTRDVSKAGICLVSEANAPVGETLRVQLVLAFGNNAFSEPLLLDARVVWCTRIGTSFQVGVMFEEVTEEQENFLEMFLQFLDGTLSPRGEHETGADDDGEDVEGLDDEDAADTKDDPFK